MTRKDLRQWLRARLKTLGAPWQPSAVLDYWLNFAGTEFCRDSRIRYVTVPISSVAGQSTYAIASDPIEILQVYYDGRRLEYKSPQGLEAYYGLDWATITGRPLFFHPATATNILLAPIPDETTAYIIRADVIAPMAWTSGADATAGTDDDSPDFVARYHIALAHGAAHQIAPNKLNADEYVRLVLEAQADSARRFSREPRRVPFRSF